MLCYSCHEIVFNLFFNVIEEYKNCAKINLLHNFYKQLIKYHHDVYTKNGDYTLKTIIIYELQKLLYKIDNNQYDDFSNFKMQ